jgi:hypothetical protein
MKIKQLSLLLGCLILVGCATPYKSNGLMGGFSERQLSDDTYRVSFQGNGFTRDERASDFLMLRCAELTLGHGAKFFRLVGSADTSQNGAIAMPQTATTTATVTTSGNAAYVQGQTTTSPGFVMPVHFPHQMAMIQIRQTKDLPTDIDATLVANAIRQEYGIR